MTPCIEPDMSGKAISGSVTPLLSFIPLPCRGAAVSLRCPSGQLLTWCVKARQVRMRGWFQGATAGQHAVPKMSEGLRWWQIQCASFSYSVDAASVDEPRVVPDTQMYTHRLHRLPVSTHFHYKLCLYLDPFHGRLHSHAALCQFMDLEICII